MHVRNTRPDLYPSRNLLAEEEWAHSMEWHNIEDILQGHDRVSPVFKHGDHEGRPVQQLINELICGKKRPGDLPTPVVASFEGKLWTVYGNRRVYALTAYARRFRERGGEPEKLKVIVHRAPFTHVDDLTRRQFMVKFVLACSTTNSGQQPYCR